MRCGTGTAAAAAAATHLFEQKIQGTATFLKLQVRAPEAESCCTLIAAHAFACRQSTDVHRKQHAREAARYGQLLRAMQLWRQYLPLQKTLISVESVAVTHASISRGMGSDRSSTVAAGCAASRHTATLCFVMLNAQNLLLLGCVFDALCVGVALQQSMVML